jgi:protein O-GlcNAcase/histone acetyltransferase
MPDRTSSDFLAGVIEGFYGPPWSPAERRTALDWMSAWQLNSYLYAPKDDLKHRALWRELYSPAEAEALGALVQECRSRGIRFIYALSPGLDIRYSAPAELPRILARFDQLRALGCDDFALLFDDIPDRMSDEDRQQFGSFAAAQCHVTNAAFRWLRERRPQGRFLFCPTPYCGRMAERQLGGANYLETAGRELAPEIEIVWTGPEIVSREITLRHIQELRVRLRRRPLIWDNLHANDYDGRRFFCGPYSGRPAELRGEVSGILSNPNTEFPLNFVPLRTLGAYLQNRGAWDARAAYVTAMTEWLPQLAGLSGPAALEDLLRFGDCFYLPHEEGPLAQKLWECARSLLSQPPAEWGTAAREFMQAAQRLRDFCAKLVELRDRPLFYALHRRIWELREELDLLLGYIQLKQENPAAMPRSDFHLPGTYRGGFVPRLQRLLEQRPDGTFAVVASLHDEAASFPP